MVERSSLARFWLGFACVAMVLVNRGLGVRRRGGSWSGLVTLRQDHELIRHYPCRYVRHPIYTGLLLAVACWGWQ
jgi:protein-S-isoprenylcysteine O-methyltransferase Ste14